MLVLKVGGLIDGISDELKTNHAILIEDDTIVAVEPLEGAVVPPEATVVDYTKEYVLPGLMDCHVHLSSAGAADPRPYRGESEAFTAFRASVNATATLKSGFTAVRNLGSPYDVDIKLKQATSQGIVDGPRLVASGRCITITGGHGHQNGLEADGPWSVRKAVRTLVKSGADVIKLMATGGVMTEGVEPGAPELTYEELKAAVDEAHHAGRLTATHAQGNTGIRNAVRAGIDSIEHGVFLDADIVEMMLKQGTALVPTLSAPHNIIANGLEGGIPQYAVDKTKKIAEAHIKSFQMAYAAGVRIGLGTDAGTPFNHHGHNSKELELMVAAGMRPMDAIKAGTSTAAQILGLEGTLGRIAPGYKADILVIAADPLKDVAVLQDSDSIKAVYLSGKQIDIHTPAKPAAG